MAEGTGRSNVRLWIASERSFLLVAAGVFVLLVCLNYAPMFVGKIPFPRDIIVQFPPWWGIFPDVPQQFSDIGDLAVSFYPFRDFAAKSIRDGTLPLWNPNLLSGIPFLANSQSALFYPPNFLYYILSFPFAWMLGFVLRMFLSALFTAIFLRSIGATTTGAIIAGLIFSSFGFMAAWQGQGISDAAIWLPLICYAVLRLQASPSRWHIILTAGAFAMPVLAGHPETAAHLTLAGSAFAFFIWIWPVSPGQRAFSLRFAMAFALSGGLAVALSGVQIVPTLEWLGQVQRELGATWPAISTNQIIGIVSRDIMRSPNSAGIRMPEGASYLGMITLLGASLAPFHDKKRYVAYFGLLTIVSLCVAYSVEPFYWIASHIPVIGGLKNGRLVLLAGFGAATLAGLGISALETRPAKRGMLISLGIASVVTIGLLYQLQLVTTFDVEFMRRPAFAAVLFVITLIPILWRWSGGLTGRRFAFAICSVALVDFVTFSYGVVGFAKPAHVYPQAPVFEFLHSVGDLSRFRAIELDGPYPANAAMVYGVQAADGYEIALGRTQAFWATAAEEVVDGLSFTTNRLVASTDRKLDMMNVKYLVMFAPNVEKISPDRFRQVFKDEFMAVVENKSVLPRAFAVPASGVEVIPELSEQSARIGEAAFDPESSVIVAELPASIERRFPTDTPFTGHVEMLGSNGQEASFLAETSDVSVLVLSQTYYPGWTATIDDIPTPVFPVNVALTGIALPAGSHNIRFAFRPVSFKIGLGLTVVGLISVVGLAIPITAPKFELWPRLSGNPSRSVLAVASIVVVAGLAIWIARGGNKAAPAAEPLSEPLIEGSAARMRLGNDPVSIAVPGGSSVQSGYAAFKQAQDKMPAGLAFLGFGIGSDAASEAVVPTATPISSGVVPFRFGDGYKTSIAMINPNSATAELTFSAANHQDVTIQIPANGKLSAYVDESPFNIHDGRGALTFRSTEPIAVSAFLSFEDKSRNIQYHMANLPVAAFSATETGAAHIPYSVRGAAWSSELWLVNPSEAALSGRYRWFGEEHSYTVPPRSSVVYRPSNQSEFRVGMIDLIPDNNQPLPTSAAVLFDGFTLTTVVGAPARLDATIYVESSDSVDTEIAVANPSSTSVPAIIDWGYKFQRVTLPPGGVVTARGRASLKRIVHVVGGTQPVVVAGLRYVTHNGERRLLSAYPSNSPRGRFFPQLVAGGPFTIEFVLFAEQPFNGVLEFMDATGRALELPAEQ